MSDPVMQALSEVDVGDGADDPGAGLEEIGEESDARPEGPMPDLEDDADALDSGEDQSGFSVLSWASNVPDGSHLDFDTRDWWDPETGGKNRLAYHLSDATGEGLGYPNGLGVLVAIGEMYWSAVRDQSGGGDDRADEGAPDAETVSRDQAEAMV